MPSSRSESAVISRRVRRLAERGFVTLDADFGRERFTHVRLTNLGREVSAELLRFRGLNVLDGVPSAT
jgi:DNA-binding MarR family transcriptional regulator